MKKKIIIIKKNQRLKSIYFTYDYDMHCKISFMIFYSHHIFEIYLCIFKKVKIPTRKKKSHINYYTKALTLKDILCTLKYV